VAINPGTGVEALSPVVELLDHILVMTVNPGFGGQALMRDAMAKVPELRRLVPDWVAIEVDGGVNRENIAEISRTGANWVIAGAAVFGARLPGAEVQTLTRLMADIGTV
jgi:ribulose-phosphate 3-epimerase